MSFVAPFLIRLSLIIIFPFSTLDKVFNWKGALHQADSGILPGGPVLLVLAMIVETGGSALILLGLFDRAAAALLIFYCVVTAILYHQFWACGDFFASGDSKGRTHFWDFLKNFGLAGGLGFVLLGAPLAAVDFAVTHPASSTPAYGSIAPAYR